MKIIESFLTENPCYKYNENPTLVSNASVRNKYINFKKNGVKGLMLHSVGCSQPSAMVFVKNWNKESYTRACVHAFIDGNTGDVYQCLPWDFRGLHGGGSSNETHIGVEMCEPSCIKYTGGSSFTCSNFAEAQVVAKRTYESAVELFASLCKEKKLDPLADGVIISHKEGHKRGIASNHGDPEHLWKGLNLPYTMDTFRQAVKTAMNEHKPEPKPETSALYRVQVGAYSVKANADAQLEKVKKAGFETYMIQVDGLYKIQVGAYSKKENADAMLEKLKKAGFDAFITTKGGQAVSTSSTKPTVEYYPIYKGNSNSIVDVLKELKVDSSFDNRKKIASKNGISNYKGTETENLLLIKLLKCGKLIK